MLAKKNKKKKTQLTLKRSCVKTSVVISLKANPWWKAWRFFANRTTITRTRSVTWLIPRWTKLVLLPALHWDYTLPENQYHIRCDLCWKLPCLSGSLHNYIGSNGGEIVFSQREVTPYKLLLSEKLVSCSWVISLF